MAELELELERMRVALVQDKAQAPIPQLVPAGPRSEQAPMAQRMQATQVPAAAVESRQMHYGAWKTFQ